MTADERDLQRALDCIEDARNALRTRRRVMVCGTIAWVAFVILLAIGFSMGDAGALPGVPGMFGTFLLSAGLPCYAILGPHATARQELREAERRHRDLLMGWD